MNTGSILKPFNKLWNGVGRCVFNCIPNTTVNTPEICNKIGVFLSRPDVNRGVMGATAILTQPLIDYYNPNVDEDTAKTSTCRTIGKITAGTFVGCGVRFLCYHGITALTQLDRKAPEWRKALLPSRDVILYLTKNHSDWIKSHRSGVANLVALIAMLFTNVLLDVPLTNKITKKLLNIFNLKQNTDNIPPERVSDTTPQVSNTDSNNPKDKIIEAFDKIHKTEKGGG